MKIFLIACARQIGIRHLIVRIDTNNTCNLRCAMCPSVGEFLYEKPIFMTLDTFKNIGRAVFSKTRMLYLSCGFEPTMTPELEKFISAAASYKIPFISLSTNGQFLKNEVINSLIRNSITEVIFSVDGARPETYEKIRVGANFEKLKENLRRLCEAKQVQNSPFPHIRFNYTLVAHNVHEINQFVHDFSAFSPREIQFRRMVKYKTAFYADHGAPDLQQTIQSQINDIQILCKRKNIHVRWDENAVDISGQEEPLPGIVDAPPPKTLQAHFESCPLRRFNLYVKSSADYQLCPFAGIAGNFLADGGFRGAAGSRCDLPLLLKDKQIDKICTFDCPARPVYRT